MAKEVDWWRLTQEQGERTLRVNLGAENFPVKLLSKIARANADVLI